VTANGVTALSAEDLAIVDDVSRLGAALWAASLEVLALNTDPKSFSVMLFRRLWSNHRGFIVLWKNHLQTEADIVLRAGLEAAICIAANSALRDDFVRQAKEDVVATLKGQIKMFRAIGATELVRAAEGQLRELLATLAPDSNPQKFDWPALAVAGGVPKLYHFHRALSGMSSHVTGLSLLQGVVGAKFEGKEQQDELRDLTRTAHLMVMTSATLTGCRLHAGMIDAAELSEQAGALVERLNLASARWA
jgi:hypothetical protein